MLVSPHPDDEVLGAGPAAAALHAGGWRVVNAAVGLGRAADRSRRLHELELSCERLGVELRVTAISTLHSLLLELAADVVVAPSPHDAHPAHERAGRAVRDVLADDPAPRAAWWWRLWGSGGPPTLVVDVEPFFERLQHALAAHSGELARNDYQRLLHARAVEDAILGAEQVFGFGAPRLPFGLAATYCETLVEGGRFSFGERRILDPASPLGASGDAGGAAEEWLYGRRRRGRR